MATSVAKLTTVTWDAYVPVFAKVTLLTTVIMLNNFKQKLPDDHNLFVTRVVKDALITTVTILPS
jgi:hypothetical protein